MNNEEFERFFELLRGPAKAKRASLFWSVFWWATGIAVAFWAVGYLCDRFIKL